MVFQSFQKNVWTEHSRGHNHFQIRLDSVLPIFLRSPVKLYNLCRSNIILSKNQVLWISLILLCGLFLVNSEYDKESASVMLKQLWQRAKQETIQAVNTVIYNQLPVTWFNKVTSNQLYSYQSEDFYIIYNTWSFFYWKYLKRIKDLNSVENLVTVFHKGVVISNTFFLK